MEDKVISSYHIADGWKVERLGNGDVRIIAGTEHLAAGEHPIVAVNDSVWASIVASVSARGENGETHSQAMEFHNKR